MTETTDTVVNSGSHIPQFIRDANLDPEFELPFVLACRQLAKDKHSNQFRIGREPYFTHVEGVAEIVATEFECNMPYAIAGAYLHDIVEDEHMTHEELKQTLELFTDDKLFIDATLHIVQDLTLELPYKCTESMKESIIFGQLVKAGSSYLSYAVKFADRLHNLRSIHKTSWNSEKKLAYTLTGLRIYNLMINMCSRSFNFDRTEGFWKARMEMEDMYIKYLSEISNNK